MSEQSDKKKTYYIDNRDSYWNLWHKFFFEGIKRKEKLKQN